MESGPEICGFYSVNADREYENSASSLRYFIPPKLPIDLNAGIDKIRSKPHSYYREKMDHILTYIVQHRGELLKKNASSQSEKKLIPCAHYITYRGILKKIMCSEILPNEWTLVVTKYKGNIYICQYTSPEEIEKEIHLDSEKKRFCNYGPMFEHYCLSDHPNRKPDTTQVCDASPQFFCVFKRNLANRQFLFAGEMDGVESTEPLDLKRPSNWKLNKFVELKLNCELNTKYRIFKFQDKAHGIWAQSYLTGVEKVHVGFRDESGILKAMRCYSIQELAKISKRKWTHSKNEFVLLQRFEADLKDIDCPYTTIKYHYDPMKGGLSSTLHKGKTEYTILPEWYLQQMKT